MLAVDTLLVLVPSSSVTLATPAVAIEAVMPLAAKDWFSEPFLICPLML
jgi:hypothetical protein